MTITLTQPPSGYIGQGITLFGTTDVSLTVNPPYKIFVAVSDFTAGLQATSAVAFISASPWGVLLGWDAVDSVFVTPQNGMDLGHALSVQVLIYDASFTLVDSGTFTGFQHDPISGYTGLLQELATIISGGPTLSDILTRVTDIETIVSAQNFNQTLIPTLVEQAVAQNPISGGVVVNLSPPTGIFAASALTWEVIVPATDVGSKVGVITDSTRRVIQAVMFYTLPLVGDYAGQTFESDKFTGTIWFQTPVPTAVSVYIWPGYTVNMSWLGL